MSNNDYLNLRICAYAAIIFYMPHRLLVTPSAHSVIDTDLKVPFLFRRH